MPQDDKFLIVDFFLLDITDKQVDKNIDSITSPEFA